MKHMIQPFGIDMHKNVLTDTKAVKHMHFYEADKTNTSLNISFIPSSTTEWIICYNDNNDISDSYVSDVRTYLQHCLLKNLTIISG